jgi:hypothetical protein
MKLYIAAVAIAGIVAATPAMAQEMKCDDASMAAVQKMIDGATDPAMKEKADAAKADMQMAMDAKAANKEADCAAALTKAGAGMTAQ